jgi:glycosyltransferase involved in cell wall biosynthesis
MSFGAAVSVLVLTKNEEQNLPGCLTSVAWSDDIHVYDSLSTDSTVAIAEVFGATVTRRAFDNWSDHQNWGLQNIHFAHPWVFYIDADERMTPGLVEAVSAAVASAQDEVAFQVQRRDFFWGQWLKHAQATPYYLRLFRPDMMRYARLVNPVSIPNGPVGRIGGYLNHYPFSRGIVEWVERHNSYSTLEALQIEMDRKAGREFSWVKALTAADFHERRYHLKEAFHRMPCRPFLRFAVLYLGRGGFMDGRAGFTYSVLQAFYEYLIVLKTRELERDVS